MSEDPESSESPESPESPESSEPDEPLGDLTRRIRQKRAGRANGERDEADALGAGERVDDASGDGNGPGVGFDFDTGAGSDTDTDGRSGGVDSTDVDADVDSDELFEEMDVSDVDTDEVWDSVLTDEAGDDPIESASPTVDIDPTQAVESAAGEDYIVSKDDYCESCHFFSAPPEVECSYEGSEIVEVVDSEQFRVRNCPVVAGTHNVYGETPDTEDDD